MTPLIAMWFTITDKAALIYISISWNIIKDKWINITLYEMQRYSGVRKESRSLGFWWSFASCFPKPLLRWEKRVWPGISHPSPAHRLSLLRSPGAAKITACVSSHTKSPVCLCALLTSNSTSASAAAMAHLCPASLINVTFFLDQLIGGRNEIDWNEMW